MTQWTSLEISEGDVIESSDLRSRTVSAHIPCNQSPLHSLDAASSWRLLYLPHISGKVSAGRRVFRSLLRRKQQYTAMPRMSAVNTAMAAATIATAAIFGEGRLVLGAGVLPTDTTTLVVYDPSTKVVNESLIGRTFVPEDVLRGVGLWGMARLCEAIALQILTSLCTCSRCASRRPLWEATSPPLDVVVSTGSGR